MASVAPNPPDLLERIEGYVLRYGLADTQFGQMVNREPGLLKTLRNGRQCGQGVLDKILAFITKPPRYHTRGSRIAAAYRRAKAATIRSEAEAKLHRATDPLEQAKQHLQRRGYNVFQASVVDPFLDGWVVGAKPDPLNDNELLDLARRRGWAG